MEKTPKMLEVEARIGEPLEDFLRREYNEIGSGNGVARKLNVHGATVSKWFDDYGITKKDRSEVMLFLSEIERPPKEELERLYNEIGSKKGVAKKLDVSATTVGRWCRKYKIPTRNSSELKLRLGVKKPTKKELERMSNEIGSMAEIARKLNVHGSTVSRWFDDYGITKKDRSEVMLFLSEIERPPKEELERLYNEIGSKKGVAKKFDVSDATVRIWLEDYKIPNKSKLPKEELERLYNKIGSKKGVARKLGVSDTTIKNWLKEYEIPTKGSEKIKTNKQLMDFLEQDKKARSLAALVIVNGQGGYDVERVMAELYGNKFSSHLGLHKLLQENREPIKELIENGITNLGTYLGDYDIGDRAIIPILVGQALTEIPDKSMTTSLEDRLFRSLRSVYSPRFNDNPESILEEVREKVKLTKDKEKSLYQRLQIHYENVISLGGELN